MDINNAIATWILRLTAILFSMILIVLFVIASTPYNSVSILVLWFMAFLFWVVYSGKELLIMSRVIILYLVYRFKGQSFVTRFDQQSIIDALILFRSRKINLWDGHIIPFLLYFVCSSMAFGYVTTNIYIVVLTAIVIYAIHTLLRQWCINIIQYSK